MSATGEAKEIRHLFEAYRDLQKLRIEVYNRIVAYCRENLERFAQALRERREGELQALSLSTGEAQTTHASQELSEAHLLRALRPSDVADMIVEEKLETPKDIEHLVWLYRELYKTEREVAKRLDAWSILHPVRASFLSRVRGIGGVLASALIAYLSPISRFPNISKLWKYAGLAPGQRRVRGQRAGYNVKLKTLCYLIATSFEKQPPEKSFYRRIYERKKRYYLTRPDIAEKIERGEPGVKAHVRMMALRYTVKRFLADLWVEWRKLEGLPVTMPYAFAVQGHSMAEYEPWQPDK